jgi:hypothetical protein
MAARVWLDQHEADLRGVVAFIGDQGTAQALSVTLDYPASLRVDVAKSN